MKKLLSILLALTITLSLCVFVSAAEESAKLVVSDLKSDGQGGWTVTVDVYYTGTAQAFYVRPDEADNFEFVSGRWQINEYDTDSATILIKDVNATTHESTLLLSESDTFNNYKIYTYTVKATANGTANINALVKSTAHGTADSQVVNTSGNKTITVDKFTCEHNWIEKANAQYLKSDATCTEPAKYYKSCSKCGEKSNETFNSGVALGHTPVEVVASKYLKSDATCSSAAVYYKSCPRCNVKLENEPTFTNGDPDASKHVWVDKSDDNNHWKECSSCSEKTNEESHSFTIPKYDSNGHWNECSCGKKGTVTPHTMKDNYDSDDNQHWHACENCDYTADEANHTWVDNSDSEYHWEECSECGKVKADSKKAHTWSTEHDSNNHWSQCPTCGYKDESTEVAHDFENGTWGHDADNHWKICSCGAEEDHTAHTEGTAADCTHKAVCADCGEEYGDYKHVEPLIHVERVEATIESDGNIEYWYCSGCNQRFLNEDGTGEISESQTIIRYNQCAANGHKMATIDCGSDEYHMMICTNDCGTILLIPHTYGLDGVCPACGHTIEVKLEEEEVVIDTPVESDTEEVDEDSTDDVEVDDKTADTNPTTGVALATLPMIVAAAALALSKRR